MAPPRAFRRCLARTVLAATLSAASLAPAAEAQGPPDSLPATRESEPSDFDRQRQLLDEIVERFSAGQHDAVLQKADEFITTYSVNQATTPVFLFQAESRYRLGQRDEAIGAYQLAIHFIRQLTNVQQRKFAWAFFRLGILYRERRELDAAIAHVEAGLRLEPQNTYYQILLGELFSEQAQPGRALKHFRDVAASAFPSNEERAVLGMKIDRLAAGKPGASFQPPELRAAALYPGLSIGILPLNDVPAEVVLSDVCVVLESKWLVRCEVLTPLAIAEADVPVADRNQYDGDRLVDELRRRFPVSGRRHRFLVAVTGRDVFGPGTNYVFSWQRRNADSGTGVISTYRFVTGLADFYEKGAVATRRLAMQAISTTGWMLGFTPPTHPECPMAYPHDFREFQQKHARLCESTLQQRDLLLRHRGGPPGTFGASWSNELARIYRTYYLE